MARRGEGQFVAMEVNLAGDPKLRAMARALRIPKAQAIGHLTLWREFVLTHGTGAGIVKGYSAAELAEFMEWEGRPPSQIIKAMRTAGFLSSRRSAYVYPHWGDTPTGWYAAKRARDRDRHGRGGSAEVPRNGEGGSAELPSGSGQEVSKDPPRPPVPGGVGGDDAMAGLAEWFLETHPRMRNERVCRRLLTALTPPEAAQLRYCLPRQLPRYIAGMSGRGGRGVPFADKYLREAYYLEFRPPKARAPKAVAAPLDLATAREIAEQKKALVERQEALWKKRDEIRKQLRDRGVPKHEVEALVDQELEKETNHHHHQEEVSA